MKLYVHVDPWRDAPRSGVAPGTRRLILHWLPLVVGVNAQVVVVDDQRRLRPVELRDCVVCSDGNCLVEGCAENPGEQLAVAAEEFERLQAESISVGRCYLCHAPVSPERRGSTAYANDALCEGCERTAAAP